MPSGKRGRFAVGTPLLQAARSLGVDIDSVCGGRGLCGRCQVLVAEGEFAKHGVSSSSASLSPFSEPEQRFSRRQPLAPGRRLSCSARVEADVVIDVPADSQVHRQVVRKEADARAIELNPVVRLHYVQVQQPDMHDPSGDLRRLFEALESEWGLKDLSCDLSVLQALQPALRAGAWQVTVAVHAEKQIIGVWPGLHERAYGLAVDVGSTTIAAHLCDLQSGEVVASAGVMNPQIRFGEDLMSRVSYSMMNPGGAAPMTAAVREALCGSGGGRREDAPASRVEDILEATLVGNPDHASPAARHRSGGTRRRAVRARDRQSLTLRANVIDLKLHRNARVYILPCIAGHVGADAAGMVLAERPDLDDAMTLLVDVGTNAEIVLGNRTAAGRLFEPHRTCVRGRADQLRTARGARGDRARAHRSRDARAALQGHRLGSVVGRAGFRRGDRGATGVTGICGSGIIEIIAEMYLAGVINQDGVVDGRLAARSPRIAANGRTFAVSCLHARAAATKAGRDENHAERRARDPARQSGAVCRHRAADGAARHRSRRSDPPRRRVRQPHRRQVRDRSSAWFPTAICAQVRSAGNAAGTGARIALLDATSRGVIETLVRRIEKVETAIEPRFQHHFVEAMAIPHKSADYTNLRKVVELPAPKESTSQSETRGRRPRRGESKKTE